MPWLTNGGTIKQGQQARKGENMTAQEAVNNVRIMYATGATHKTLSEYVETLYEYKLVTSRIYELCLTMVEDLYRG